jgi:hypothetical protein
VRSWRLFLILGGFAGIVTAAGIRGGRRVRGGLRVPTVLRHASGGGRLIASCKEVALEQNDRGECQAGEEKKSDHHTLHR